MFFLKRASFVPYKLKPSRMGHDPLREFLRSKLNSGSDYVGLGIAGLAVCLSLWLWLPSVSQGRDVSEVETKAGVAFGETDAIVVPGIAGLAADATVWFRVAKEGRTLASGSAVVSAGNVLRLPVALPELKPGAMLPLELALRHGAETGKALFEGRLWAFSRQRVAPEYNPVAPRTLHLYDPEGRTEEALRELGLAFESVPRLDALGALRDAVLVVGEGLSLDAERGLLDALTDALEHGTDVLLLAPRDGTLPVPSSWRRLVAGSLRDVFPGRKRDPGRQSPDTAAFVRPDPSEHAGFRLCGLRDEAVFEVADGIGAEAVGWEAPASAGRFRACGTRLVAHWDKNPAARWLLVELLDHLSTKGTLP
jgi:hypothetical protein